MNTDHTPTATNHFARDYANLEARVAQLEAALAEIAERGPVIGYSSGNALRLRLIGSQSIARAALANTKEQA